MSSDLPEAGKQEEEYQLASEKGFLGLSWLENVGRCYCCFQASLDSCCLANGGTGDCWVAEKSPGK